MNKLKQLTNNNPEYGHIMCYPIRSLNGGDDVPNRHHNTLNSVSICKTK